MTPADKALYGISIAHLSEFIRSYVPRDEHIKVLHYVCSQLYSGVLDGPKGSPKTELAINAQGEVKIIPTFGKARRTVHYRYYFDHTTKARIQYRDTITNDLVDEFELTGTTYYGTETAVDAQYPNEITYLHGNALQNTIRVPTLRNLH